ncbi:cytochrome b/b6 domain-containing protein [Xanthobacter sp. TB0139]|uniref:cytochrome b/b6 domain-containing protein n=1 Tax=Xanthobacter sp. TB0139 TaxID=3459178 RepID=UPI004039DE3D
MDNKAQATGSKRWVKVWDGPVRLFHWALVALVATAYISAETGKLDLHFMVGYTILTLVLFRILWGLVGSDTARFTQFIKSPAAAFAHLGHVLRRQPEDETGHNPAGAFMVVALLALLLFQTITGLFSNDGLFEEGPLAHLLGGGWSDTLTIWHGFSFDLIVIAVVAHVAAILLYAALLRQDLVRPMVTGWKRLPQSFSAPHMAPVWLALAMLVLAAVVVWVVVNMIGAA